MTRVEKIERIMAAMQNQVAIMVEKGESLENISQFQLSQIEAISKIK